MSKFGQTLTTFAANAGKKISEVRRAVVIELFSSVIADTPVLTGRLRGNWQTSIGSPKKNELGVRAGSAAQQEVQDTALKLVNDQTIFLRNNLPYAARIEYEGWSKQKAPAGMMRKNVARLTEIMQKKIRS